MAAHSAALFCCLALLQLGLQGVPTAEAFSLRGLLQKGVTTLSTTPCGATPQWDSSFYHCLDGMLCPKELSRCGLACYDPAVDVCEGTTLRYIGGDVVGQKQVAPAATEAPRTAAKEAPKAPDAAGLPSPEPKLTAAKTSASSTQQSSVAGGTFETFSGGRTFRVVNNCGHTVWPAVLANPGSAVLGKGGWEMASGTAVSFSVPEHWQGRLWGRTGCSFTNGKGFCETGGCGDRLQCGDMGGAKPATLAEILLSGWQGQDFYDISLVDGYNIKMLMRPVGKSSQAGYDDYWCGVPLCTTDLNTICPEELKVKDSKGAVIACMSACEKFLTPEHCCTGAHNGPDLCFPSTYSKVFKGACPTSYSYAYDDASSTFSCKGTDYEVVFCPA